MEQVLRLAEQFKKIKSNGKKIQQVGYYNAYLAGAGTNGERYKPSNWYVH